ncbi:hypothetical protein [Aquimarina agarilytica]|uniref:hypothetical protein n=1 Tax=Aquimarina agarilytica TaxID=1087449 RepID=UPI00028A2B3D|nr:hypothetical protein [Aquimarina agarilytica]
MPSKRKKIVQHLHKCIKHDFGFYNPEWKWDSLPDDIRDNYDLIKNTLDKWENDGCIEVYSKDNIRYIKIIKVPQL